MSHDAFMRAIRAAPDDDAPRLVYADWLEENGDPMRAEFIRVQCTRARLPADDPAAEELNARSYALLVDNWEAWVGPSASSGGARTAPRFLRLPEARRGERRKNRRQEINAFCFGRKMSSLGTTGGVSP